VERIHNSILFIPDYVYRALGSYWDGYNCFFTAVDNILIDNKVNKEDGILMLLRTKLSKYDIEDIIAANNIAKTYLGINDVLIKRSINYERLLINLTDNTGNLAGIKNINMTSTTGLASEAPFELMVSEYALFVVLQNGFSNFIRHNVLEFRIVFLNILINYLIKICGIEEMFKSKIFSDFNYLVYRNTI